MKVELNDIRLGTTGVTGSVMAGIPAADKRSFRHARDVTNDFRKAVIEVFGGYETIINAPDGKWVVTVKKESK